MAKYLDIQPSPIALNYSCAPSVNLLNSLHAAGPACALCSILLIFQCFPWYLGPVSDRRLWWINLTCSAFLFICFPVVVSSGSGLLSCLALPVLVSTCRWFRPPPLEVLMTSATLIDYFELLCLPLFASVVSFGPTALRQFISGLPSYCPNDLNRDIIWWAPPFIFFSGLLILG